MADEELVNHIRERVRRVREVASMAHDPRVIEMLLKIAEDGEADLRKIEEERKGAG